MTGKITIGEILRGFCGAALVAYTVCGACAWATKVPTDPVLEPPATRKGLLGLMHVTTSRTLHVQLAVDPSACLDLRLNRCHVALRLRGGAGVHDEPADSGGSHEHPSSSAVNAEVDDEMINCPGAVGHQGLSRRSCYKPRPRNIPLCTGDWRDGKHVGGYSAVIDVRTPAEFADDHIPGALNYPVLSNAERHEVGLKYAASHFEGRKLGAQLISANIAQILAQLVAGKNSTFSPLIYCWRGGKRSNALAHVLAEIGFRSSVLEGGYRSYRRGVVAALAELPCRLTWRVITGPTGSGKTAMLHYLQDQGHQVLDLEHLANHRGSVLGANNSSQPSQKAFESRLAEALRRMSPDRPVFVEDEASYIGAIHIPFKLWQELLRSQRYSLAAPLHVRVAFTLEHYRHLTASPTHLKNMLARLGKYHAQAQIREWLQLVEAGAYDQLVTQLLEKHYDPANRRSIANRCNSHGVIVVSVPLVGLDRECLAQAAQEHLCSPLDGGTAEREGPVGGVGQEQEQASGDGKMEEASEGESDIAVSWGKDGGAGMQGRGGSEVEGHGQDSWRDKEEEWEEERREMRERIASLEQELAKVEAERAAVYAYLNHTAS
jgi:tRNA 2-selenouridine synthase